MEQTPVPTAPLFNAFMHDLAKQLVPLIVAELKHQTNAEGMGMIALDPNNLALPVHSLLTEDKNTQEAVQGILEAHYDDTLNDIVRRLDKVETEVSDLDTKVDEIETNADDNKVDADNHEFADAVISVLRKSI
jgi:peptidoglycan hydrolase CwlO-like protein